MAKAGKNHKGGNTDAGSGIIVNGQELARIFGVSRQYITTFRKAGMPIHDNEGPRKHPRYNTAACIRWKRDADIKKARGDAGADGEDPLDIDEIRRRTELAKMKKEEIDLAVLEERYGDIEAILEELSAALVTIRASLIALPKIAPQLEHMDSADVELRMEEEIYRILEELADFTADDDEDDDSEA